MVTTFLVPLTTRTPMIRMRRNSLRPRRARRRPRAWGGRPRAWMTGSRLEMLLPLVLREASLEAPGGSCCVKPMLLRLWKCVEAQETLTFRFRMGGPIALEARALLDPIVLLEAIVLLERMLVLLEAMWLEAIVVPFPRLGYASVLGVLGPALANSFAFAYASAVSNLLVVLTASSKQFDLECLDPTARVT
ncbi:unnamed protein product [Prorocentrum cordatum]|uniref:H(+)-exporting diphosphatase n=1 Tax=Prorocentrum cordatum TaxID=2364126 RepID=A0ABN9QGS0_9DINO|nr:unnamed protein product [Polarella glacialis]